ncbi:hypothetical protein BJ138DRAFT_1010527, partial [Hygrophoropsis aurantiaca]
PTALEDFFGQYSGFNYNPSQSASREFYRLCDFNTWEREDAERQVAYDAFKTALVVQFNHVYGTDEHSLSAWRNLCEVIGVVPIPEGLAACRKAVRSSHVNIVDLVDAKGTGNTVTRFLSEEELSEYTQMNSKYFPKGSACAGGLLKYLLHFFAQYSNFSYNPSESASREFYRLCNFNNWDREDTERADAHEAFKTALVIQFNHIYGTDEHSLSAWRDLCEVIGVSPIPDGLAACRKAVRGSHVNIVDLVDAKGTGDAVTRFGSTRELSEYTKLTGKFFPKENAYAGGLLNCSCMKPILYQQRQPHRTRPPRNRRNISTTANIVSPSALEDFFAQYSDFTYDPSESASHEFYRLCKFRRWDRYNPERQDAHDAFKTALVIQFNNIYGTDAHSLSAWRDLCEVIGVVPIPEGLAACRKAVRGSHVNIVDLVDAKGTGNTITRFPSEEELSAYTRQEGKYFPKESAYAGGLLKYLLRQILAHEGVGYRGNRLIS